MGGLDTIETYFNGWGVADSAKDREMAQLFSRKAIDEGRRIEIKWNGDHYITFYPDGTLTRAEHEGQEHEFKKYEEVATIGVAVKL